MRHPFKSFIIALKSLALFRLLIALMIILAMFPSQGRSRFFMTWPESSASDSWRWILGLSAPPYNLLFLSALTIFGLLLFVGYRTRTVTLLCFCGSGLAVLSGMGQFQLVGGVLLPVLFWSCFLPLGAKYSLDSAMNTAIASLPAAIASGATIALLVQQCLNYWLPETLFWSDIVSSDALGTVSPLRSALWLVGILTPLLLLIPVRTQRYRLALVAVSIFLHVIAVLFFDQPALLHLIAIATWTIYLPQSLWDSLSVRISTSERRGLTLYYDADCGFCKKVVHVLRTVLILPGTPLLTAQSDPSICQDMETYNSWVVVDWQQNRYFKFEAIAYICSLSPIFHVLTPVLRWQSVMGIGTRFYEAIANNRKRAGLLTKFLHFEARTLRLSQMENWLVYLAIFIYVAIHLPNLTQEIYNLEIDAALEFYPPLGVVFMAVNF